MMLTAIPNLHKAHKFSSVWVAAIGTVLGGIGSALSGIANIWPWLHPIHLWINSWPRWVVWGGGALVCLAFLIARLTLFKRKQEPAFIDEMGCQRRFDD